MTEGAMLEDGKAGDTSVTALDMEASANEILKKVSFMIPIYVLCNP